MIAFYTTGLRFAENKEKKIKKDEEKNKKQKKAKYKIQNMLKLFLPFFFLPIIRFIWRKKEQ